MKYRSTDEIRNLFLDFFEENNHMIEPGANLVPKNDKTLLWINSGVAALKRYFDGSVTPSNRRIANAQKAIRTNDIENVGKTARHHTFFEMLGNFSIGDYFKEEAIKLAWEFLTSDKYIGMDKDKIYVSIHTNDDEAYDIWVNTIKFDPKKILRSDDNYWEIGEGPSGPNSEIFYDRGTHFDPENIGEKLFFEEIDNDRYLEVWNIVFSQYDAKEGVSRDQYQELPQKNIDTGMGLERLVCIVQDVETNFDIDIFKAIINEIEKYSSVKYEGKYQESFKIISDHIRTIVFALGDGAFFSNEGRGYVLRRLLRRAVRHGKLLGINDQYLYKLVRVVSEVMSGYYPELMEKIEFSEKIIFNEEIKFMETLTHGEQHLQEQLKLSKDNTLDGKSAFKLYDTYGFPIELTVEIANESNYEVDLDQFYVEMEKQKERARAAREKVDSMSAQSEDLLKFDLESEFVGYNQLNIEAKIIGLFVDGKSVNSTNNDALVIFDKTPFYAESGGQVGDTGYINLDGNHIEIYDTQKAPLGQSLHYVKNDDLLSVGDSVLLEVDKLRRLQIKRNHSSVHLLHSALINTLGDHISQAGSFVNDKYARLDFTHFEKIDDKTLLSIEQQVNDMINNSVSVDVDLMPIDQAKESGAIALFDEKYSDLVRVVTMGEYSKELCGGTHVDNIGELGIFKIISEESVGSGVRRLTFTTSQNVYKLLNENISLLDHVVNTLNVASYNQIDNKLLDILNDNKNLTEKIKEFNQLSLDNEVSNLKSSLIKKSNFNLITKVYNDLAAKDLKYLVDSIRNELSDILVILATTINNKVVFVVACDKNVNNLNINAGDIAKELAIFTNGNGGGRKDFAQSGGKDVNLVDQAIESVTSKFN